LSDWVTLAASLAGAGLAAAAMTLLRSSLDPALFPAFWIAMLIVPLRALIHLRNGALLGLDRPVIGTAPTTALYPTVLLFAVAVVAVVDPDALTAAWAVTLALGASALTLVWASAVTRRARSRPIAAVPAAPQLRTWLSAALPMMMITALGIVNLRADVIMVGAIVNAPAAGVYFIASQVAFGVRFGMIAATPALSSVAASLHDAGATAELQAAVKAAARVVFAIAAAAFVFLVLAGGQVLAFFGNEFRDGYQALMLLGTGTLMMMALGPVESVLMMTGHERRAALSGGIATLVNVGLNAALIPSFGIEGAAAATALSGVAWAVVLNRQVSRHLGIDAGVVALR
ncbi:MAG: polysaccharide biosynthesis C-terminal domain-containing protein, partial [Dehalococcoidia bacterium]